MSEEFKSPRATPPAGTRTRSAERDAQIRAGVYVGLAAVTVVVLVTLGFLSGSERVFAAGRALGLEEVALRLEQGSRAEAMQKLREIAPELRSMGWDTSHEVDAALRQIRRTDRAIYVEALRYLTGRKLPETPRKEEPQPETGPGPQQESPVSPSAI